MSLRSVILNLNVLAESVGGPLVIAIFYWTRFHTLKGTRSYTTLALYWSGVLVFILPFVLGYFVLAQHAGISPLTAICAMMLLWLIPWAPEGWRDFCQRLARIPFFAYRLRNILANCPFEVRQEDWPHVRLKLSRVGYKTDDFRAVQSTAIQSRFLKITTIMYHLEQWKLHGSAFLERNSEHYSDLLSVYDLLSFKAVRALKNTAAIYGAIIEESRVEPGDWSAIESVSTRDSSTDRLQATAKDAAGCMLEDLRKDMDFLLDHLLLLVARGALASEFGFAGRKRRLEAIGFSVKRPRQVIIWPVAAALAIMVGSIVIWIAATSNWADYIAGDRPGVGVLRAFVVSPLNVVLNICVVYHLKRNYAFANEGMFRGFPLVFILTIGALTALIMFPVQALFDHYQFKSRDYTETVLHNLPVLIYIWVTGTVTALLVQESMWKSFRTERSKSVMDGVVFGAGLAFAVAVLSVTNSYFPIPVMEKLPPLLSADSLIKVLGFSFASGFALGFLLMRHIRKAASLRFSREQLILNVGSRA